MASERSGRTRLGSALAVAVVLVAAVIGALLLLGDDGEDVEATSTTTTAPEATTTTAPAVITAEEAATVVWPDPFGALRYDDPMAAVVGYAEELVGFEAPVYGEYQGGDARSGEVSVQAVANGPVTTVFARQMSDDHWYVLGSATPDIELDEPSPGTAIDDPLQLRGRARAFEGTVQVSVLQRGSTAPLGEGYVTGSGDGTLAPFAGEVRWANPGGGWGVVLLYTVSMENGQVWEAGSIPVGFIGGD